jgi:hypothetical protein
MKTTFHFSTLQPYSLKINHFIYIMNLMIMSLALLMCGCAQPDSSDSIYSEAISITQTLTLKRHLMAFDETREQVWVMDTDKSKLSTSIKTLDPPNWVVAKNFDETHVAILASEARTLMFISPNQPQKTFDVKNPYNALKLSKDNRFALVWYNEITSASDELFNPNAYALIDLESGEVTQRSLRSFGDAPIDVLFVPPIQLKLDDTPAYYALFLFDSYVTFANLTEGQYEVTAQLKLDATSPSIVPQNVLFSNWVGEEASVGRFAYLTASGSSDIYALNLLAEIDEEGVTRLKPSINQLPSGVNPEQMIRYRGADDREKLLVVNRGDQTLSVIDASTASVLKIPLNTSADQIYPYRSTDTGEELALIYSQTGESSIVTFVKLTALEERRGQALTQLELESPITQLVDSPLEGQAIAFHTNASGLSLINLKQEFANPLRSNTGLQSWVLDREHAKIYASIQGSSKLTVIQLETSQVSAIDIKRTIDQITLVAESKTILLTHPGAEGNFTVLNTESLDFDSSSFYGAVYLKGVLK